MGEFMNGRIKQCLHEQIADESLEQKPAFLGCLIWLGQQNVSGFVGSGDVAGKIKVSS